MDFNGQGAVVTGGESGIGRACALALASAGARVTLTFFADADAGAETVAMIERAGGRAEAVRCDVGDEKDVEALFAAADRTSGPVRLLVNSAGVNMSGVPIAQMDLALFDRTLRSDLYGPFLTCRRMVRGLTRHGMGGRIVNVSSIHEQAPRAGGVDYDAAKGGLAQLTRTLALELAPHGIAVNGVAPGMILTDIGDKLRRERVVTRARAESGAFLSIRAEDAYTSTLGLDEDHCLALNLRHQTGIERMRGNCTAALAGQYTIDFATVPSATTTQAQRDLAEWRAQVARVLPDGRGAIAVNATTRVATVTVRWDDARGDQGQENQPENAGDPALLEFTESTRLCTQ